MSIKFIIIYWGWHGCSLQVVSSLSPRDAYMWLKRFVHYITVIMWPITIIAKITWSLFWLEHTAYVCEALGNLIRHNQQMKENPQDNQRSKSNIITSWIQELEYQGLFWQKYHEIDKATI